MIVCRVFCIFFAIIMGGCQSWQLLSTVPSLQEKNIALGNKLSHVQSVLGSPRSQLNFQRQGKRISVWVYDKVERDFVPSFAEDDTGILPPSSGEERYRILYRLIFVDAVLHLAEDYVSQEYSVLPESQQEMEALIQEIGRE